MRLNERIQHWILAVTFVVLLITGFMLKFPDAWWAAPIFRLSDTGFRMRGIVHRIAGALLISTGLYHLYYLAFCSRGRRLIQDLLPTQRDFREFRASLRYLLGVSKTKPEFGRFSYIEKAEYWALVWGTVIMGGTGIILWFNTYFIDRFTLLGWDVAQAIHCYEAWLATLAIVVWHFYFTIFNPNVYPMNASWIHGMLSEEEMAVEHPRELDEIRSRQMHEDLDEESNDEPPRQDEPQ